jgi:membrane-associated phospholipid phosphatase
MKDGVILGIKIGLIALFIGLSIGLEPIYRDPLFTYSINFTKQWQEEKSLKNFFKIITSIGTEVIILPMIIVVFLWLPLNKSYGFISAVIYSVYFDNLMKAIYGNTRPYWKDPSIFTGCDGGYGNPSGHSFSSSAIYLSFWHIMTDYDFFKSGLLGISIRIGLLIFFLLLITCIMLSRVYLGFHGLNQILYGASLGFPLYYIIFNIFSIHKMSANEFFDKFRNFYYNVSFSIWFGLLMLASILTYGLISHDNSEWEKVLTQFCPDLPKYRKFNDDALYGMLTICGVVGMHTGLKILIHLTELKFPFQDEAINHWYKGEWKAQIYRALLTIVFISPVILTMVIPKTSSLGIIYVFKFAVPYFLSLFLIYGFNIYCCFLLKIGNPEVHEMGQAKLYSDIASQIEKALHLSEQ